MVLRLHAGQEDQPQHLNRLTLLLPSDLPIEHRTPELIDLALAGLIIFHLILAIVM